MILLKIFVIINKYNSFLFMDKTIFTIKYINLKNMDY